jgi:negative regulator of genetic competence, sporulation and motility
LGNKDGHRIALEVLNNESYDSELRDEAASALAEIGVRDPETERSLQEYKEEGVASKALERLRGRT